ncbi:MAG TPA: PHB depolymerase family esterase, partial [Acidimicrobiales bacterium]
MRPTALAVLVALAAAATAPGCSSTASSAGSADTAASAPHPTALGGGCGRAADPGPTGTAPFGDVVQTLTVAGTPRSYRLAVPASYRPDRPTPLILDFHGSGSDAVQQSAYSDLPSRAAAAGYLVVTPDALDANWDLAAPGTPTRDQQLVAALESDLGARYCVDRTRIYAAGISLGSEFATIVACDPVNRIAAVGLVAAEYLLRPCHGPLPVLAFHG